MRSAAIHPLPPLMAARTSASSVSSAAVRLAVSLLLAAVGGKRWHAMSGGVFVAFLALHLAGHRRHLLR
ncbi:MAG: hypothetical protein A2045_16280 [Rhodocyclales bacterium GWA2_65_20]|nr:MAG: hypothetical protein A2045_16280 [Rhodocyclales bacterium GWA2_65_20]